MFRSRTVIGGVAIGATLSTSLLLANAPLAAAGDLAPGIPAPVSTAGQLARLVSPNQSLRRAADGGGKRTVVLSGTLTDRAGAPVAGAPLRVDLEPSRKLSADAAPKVGVALVDLDETRSDDAGRFTLRTGRLRDLTGYLNPDGTVSLLVTSFGPDHRLLYHLKAYPPTRKRSHWSWSTADGTAKRGATSAAGVRASTSASSSLSGLTLRAYPAPSAQPAAGAVTEARTPPNRYCTGVTYYWVRYDRTRIKTMDRVQRMYTRGRTKWTYDWSTDAQTRVDAAANLGHHGALVSAGFTSVQTRSAGVKFRAGHYKNYDAAVQFENRPYYLYCHDVPSGKTWYSGLYEWRPFKFTGANTHKKPRTRIFKCRAKFRSRIGDTTWVARKSSFTYGVGASISTARLRVQQTNNRAHKLVFHPTTKHAWLCGSNDFITFARQVREVPRP